LIFSFLLADFYRFKKTDNIPETPNLTDFPRVYLVIGFSLSAALALLIGYFFSYKMGVIVTSALTLIFFHVLFLKKLPIIGSLVISFLAAFTLFILMAFDPNLKGDLVLIFSILIFGMYFILDFLRSMENMDIERASGFYTLPVLAGLKISRIFLVFFLFLYILVITTGIRIIVNQYYSAPLSYIFLSYAILCIGLPLFHLMSKLQMTYQNMDFRYLRNLAGYILFTETLSILFF
jgi:4-hydroxybenzoate polyprenyltransferase